MRHHVKKLFLVIPLTMLLGACATPFGQKVELAWQMVTSASVSPTQIIIAGNAFDAAEASATQYLTYCKVNAALKGCDLKTRQTVVAAVRAGRTARNQLEPYVTSGTAGPSAIYNTLIATITSLQSNLSTGAAK
jgi:hypothetical protein